MKIEKKDLTKEVLSNLFETASYGNSSCGFKTSKKQRELTGVKEQYGCDECAEVLLRGGKVWYIDYEAEDPFPSDSVSNYDNCTSFPACGCLKYGATLDEIVEHLNDVMDGKWAGKYNADDPRTVMCDIVKLITEDTEGDMYTAWNVAQAAFFGEIVYG